MESWLRQGLFKMGETIAYVCTAEKDSEKRKLMESLKEERKEKSLWEVLK